MTTCPIHVKRCCVLELVLRYCASETALLVEASCEILRELLLLAIGELVSSILMLTCGAAFRGKTRQAPAQLGCLTRDEFVLVHFEEKLGLSLDIVFDLELVQVEHHVLQHVDCVIIRLGHEICGCLIDVRHCVHDGRVASGLRWLGFFHFRRHRHKAQLR